jgi:hypothetical protein
MKFKKGDEVVLKGTKSTGDSWDTFVRRTDHTPETIYKIEKSCGSDVTTDECIYILLCRGSGYSPRFLESELIGYFKSWKERLEA